VNQRTATFLLQGGLDLVTPAIAVPAGRAIAGLNYEPDVSGYQRIGGYERYDGRPSPSAGSDSADTTARRAAITAVPGHGPVRGVWIYDRHVYAFRDTVSGDGAMYRDSPSGWEQMSFGDVVFFINGTQAFTAGQVVGGGTSSASARIERVALRSGTFSGGDATGYLVVSNLTGAFENAETITDGLAGSAECSGSQAVELTGGGVYDFENHNFYGAASNLRMYFTNGVQTAFEWDGRVLSPILTGTDVGPLSLASFVLTRSGDNILTRDSGRVLLRTDFDKPLHVKQFSEHLFLTFAGGSVIFSGIGEPLDYRVIAGAGEIGLSDEITGMLSSAASALMVFGRDRVSYLTGRDATTFVLNPLSSGSGAYPLTMQMMDQPMFLDDGGVRRLSTTDAFGDWRMGTLTQAIEPIFLRRRKADIRASASLRVKARDQYRLFYADGAGITIYLGREIAECMPFRLPVAVTCACAGELNPAQGGERMFAGTENGFVHELDVGTSFDGAEINAFIRFPWNSVGAPVTDKRYHKATIEGDMPSDATLGVAFDVNYARPGEVSGARDDTTVAAGSRTDRPIDVYANIDWTRPDQGVLETWLDGIGRNIAITVISDATNEEPHTLSALTLNFTPRKLNR
jgi:hypothetical protein